MKVPHGVALDKKTGDCFPLHKVLYGIKQAGRVWYEKLDHCLLNLRFKNSVANQNLYVGIREYVYLLE